MTHSSSAPLPAVVLQPLGDPTVDSCEGDACVVPEHHNQAVVNRALDDNAV
ncbi:MAG: hypothetical protein Q8M65_09100 [Rhodoglobus sp.]|nr:hypothetical protein [Rhodoglobus sp.]